MLIRQNGGFTLIELMIVVAIVGIIAAVAYPSYKYSVQKSNRSDAKVTLTTMAQHLERCQIDSSTYLNCTGVTNASTVAYTLGKGGVAGKSDEGLYTISGSAAATTFSLTATATGGQAADSECATFTLTHTGKETSTSSSDCW